MKILPVRSIKGNVFSTLLAPSEWGTSTVVAADELAMLEDFPQVLKYSDIDFSGKFIVTNGNPIMSEDSGAVEVTLDLNNKEFIIDENLSIELEVDANKILDTFLDETVFKTKQLYAQAQIILFETKVKARIKELLEVARSNVNDFETTVEETL